MADNVKTDPSIIPPDGTPMADARALKISGWDQVDGKNWKRGGGTPMSWEEALLVMAVPVAPVVPPAEKERKSELKMTVGMILAFLGAAAAVGGDLLPFVPEAQRPLVSVIMIMLAAGANNRYTTVRAVAKAATPPKDDTTTPSAAA